jgi:protein involved in polysaccharide export with SLBB domain
MKLKQFCLLFLFFLCFISASYAQNNLADVKVDNLTDAQVRQLISRANAMGYQEAQLSQMAAAQGMKADEIEKLKLRIEKLNGNKAQGSNNTNTTEINRGLRSPQSAATADTTSRSKEGMLANLDEQKLAIQQLFEGLKPKIFGSALFRNGNITFEPNLRIATPRGYIIGPDDKLIIDINGDNEASYDLAVSTDGVIVLPYVGRVSVGGLSIEQAISKIKTVMSGTYPALRSGRTTLAVNLGNIRSIKVTITGQAVKTGTYTISSLATVYNALTACGGPSDNGTYRNIQVIRNNRVVATIDVYDFLLKGIQKNNIRLQDQDVINIPVYDKRIELAGEIKQPAFFEIVKSETLQDLINFAGGYSNLAYTANVKVLQNTAKERRIVDVSQAEFNTYEPNNGDKVLIEPILERFENRVEITGAVFRPGQFELERGLTLKGLINKADGVTEDAFLYRGYINRLNPDNTASLISFDVSKILSGANADVPLQREDKVMISSIFDLRDEYTLTVQGEVRQPGTIQFADQMRLEDLIQLAGGFKEGATPNRIEIARRIKNSDVKSSSARIAEIFTVNIDPYLQLSDASFKLEPFDIVSVRNAEGYTVQTQVKLEGEVLYPGFYTITKKDESISDVIARAGGLTTSAYAEGASLKRAYTKSDSKNAIDTKEEEEKKLLNLKRVQESGVKDTLSTDLQLKLIQSDLVGINLVSILKSPKKANDLLLEDGDIIRVPKMLQIVKVTGEVLNPNSIVYMPNKNLKQYINGAGGFTNNALKNNVYIKYANGSAEAAKRFLFFGNYPKVKPGAEIMVPKRAEREKISPQAWIGIGTALASLGAIIVSILK